MSNIIGVAALTVSAIVPLWTARAVLSLAVAMLAKGDVRRRPPHDTV
jgi:hypothetical protein